MAVNRAEYSREIAPSLIHVSMASLHALPAARVQLLQSKEKFFLITRQNVQIVPEATHACPASPRLPPPLFIGRNCRCPNSPAAAIAVSRCHRTGGRARWQSTNNSQAKSQTEPTLPPFPVSMFWFTALVHFAHGLAAPPRRRALRSGPTFEPWPTCMAFARH